MTHSNGSILHPIVRASPSSPRDAILYLPPGPLSLLAKRRVGNQHSEGPTYSGHDGSFSSPQHILASKTLSTVITLNYRLGSVGDTSSRKQNGVMDKGVRHFTFPAPVHDTLAGFDWIFCHIKPSRLCVFGTNVGGSLALMLGLTEPRSVHAIVAVEPVCDWTGLDGFCLPPPEVGDDGNEEQVTKKKIGRRKGKKDATPTYPDLVPLLEARRQFFSKPENYFDSFASPSLFVRSAGKDCPSDFPTYLSGPDYPVPVLEKSLPEQLDMDEELEMPTKPIRRRKALSRWPPYGLDYQVSGERRVVSGTGASRAVDITLPWVRLFIHSSLSATGEISELADGVESLNLDAPPSDGLDSMPAPKVKTRHARSRRRPTEAGMGEESVLASQGVEMVSLLHAACFFGREKSFGEERVKLVRVPILSGHSGSPLNIESAERDEEPSRESTGGSATHEDPVARQAGEWFQDILHKEEER